MCAGCFGFEGYHQARRVRSKGRRRSRVLGPALITFDRKRLSRRPCNLLGLAAWQSGSHWGSITSLLPGISAAIFSV
jgi:hypothetical protein